MVKPNEGSESAKDSEHRKLSLLPERSGRLALLLLLLGAGGVVISQLAVLLGAVLTACLLALWAVPTLAVAAALIKRVRDLWSKRHKAMPEPLPPEGRNPESITKTGELLAGPKGQRIRRSKRWVFTLERITDENKG